MALYLLNEELEFPLAEDAGEDGLLAIGGDLEPARLLLAYQSGIFPWYGPDDPIMWWSPDPRCVLRTADLKVSKSMRNIINQRQFEVSFDEDFRGVVERCRKVNGREEATWITPEMITAYTNLHELGLAHSVEVRKDGKLVGGLYGISIGRIFMGESMFSDVSNASKFAFIHLVRTLRPLGFEWLDCQIYSDHLGTLGAVNISRKKYLEILRKCMKLTSVKGNWKQLLKTRN